jgi:hypothetical protein
MHCAGEIDSRWRAGSGGAGVKPSMNAMRRLVMVGGPGYPYGKSARSNETSAASIHRITFTSFRSHGRGAAWWRELYQ